jgi:excisionase family DNA binding protein
MSDTNHCANNANTKNLLDVKEAAEYLGLKNHNSLYVIQCNKSWKLPYIKVGKLVRYRKEDLEAFLLTNLHNDGGQNG